MAIRQLRTMGDPILGKISKEVKLMTPRVDDLITDLFDTMREEEGVGLAAVQVGVLKRICVIETDEEHSVCLINPVIIEEEGEQEGSEGCLSVPGKAGIVKRPMKVKVKALNENMEEVIIEGEELFARALCHEIDHLDGHLYTEKVIGELRDVSDLSDDEEEEE